MPASIDFALKPQDEPNAFEVVLFTDPQPEDDVEVSFIRDDVIEALRDTPAKFGLTAGDVMFDDLSLYERYNRIVGTVGLPWWNIGGNHDLNFEAPDRTLSRETFKRVYGPNYHAFFYARTLFLMLDDVDYLGHDPAKPKGAGKYEGRIDARQLEFVRQLLSHTSPETLIVVVMHIPITNALDPQEPYDSLTNRDALFALFEGRKYTVSFAGHTHTTEHHYFGSDRGWQGEGEHHHHILTAVSGSWWSGPYDHRGVAVADSRDGTPNGFHILSVEGLAYKTRFVAAKEPGFRQMRLSVDSRFHRANKEIDRDFRPGQLLTSPIAKAHARRGDADRQHFRRGAEDERGRADRRSRGAADAAHAGARPVRGGVVRAQRGGEKAVGEGGGFLACLDRAAARRSRRRRSSRRRRGDQ